MKTTYMIALMLAALTACSSSTPSFKSMSEQELVEYNSSVSYLDRVSCQEDTRTGSHVRKRTCNTYRVLAGGGTTRLDTASSGVSLVVGQGGRNVATEPESASTGQLPANEDIEDVDRFVEEFKRGIIPAKSDVDL